MRIQDAANFNGLFKKEASKKESATQGYTSNTISTGNTLSFMSIPTFAFMGKLVIPKVPNGFKPLPKPMVHIEPQVEKAPEKEIVDYSAIPQDPLVTPEPEIYTLAGKVKPGPSNDRIMIEDASGPAKPDAEGNFKPIKDTPQAKRVNSFLFAAKTLKMYEEALGRTIPYAFPSKKISVHPLAGEMANAYYSRWDEEIKLFYFNNEFKPDEICYTSEMADVITHEKGHSILDGLRPSYIGWGSAGGAVHEGFGDSTAMLVALSNNNIIDKVLESTGGDLRQENLVASLAEQFGKAIYGNKLYLRNAINDLKQSDFESGRESKEEHNYGRLLAGTFYDILTDMAAMHTKNGITKNYKEPQRHALMKTRADLTKLFARAMGDFSPPGTVYFDDVARALLKADKNDFNGKYKDLLTNIFEKRGMMDGESIKNWEVAQNNIPKLTLPPKAVESNESIVAFINDNKAQLGLPQENNYQLESAYSNNFGETFIQMTAPKLLKVDFNGVTYGFNIYEGVTAGFDKNGKLFHLGTHKTSDYEMTDAIDDVRNELTKLKSAQDNGLKIRPRIYRAPGDLLVKAPVLEDPVSK